jgi:hypothetical protein
VIGMKSLCVALALLFLAAGSASGWEPWGLQDAAVAELFWDDVGETGIYAATLGDSAYVSHNGGELWQRWNRGLVPDTLRALADISPFGKPSCPYVMIYAATPSGVWCRWTEDPSMADSSWHPLNEGLSDLDVTAVASGYAPPYWSHFVLCGTSTGSLYKRRFDEESWEDISSPLFGIGPIVSIAADWDCVFVVSRGAAGDGLFRSCDWGQSWVPLAVGETVVLIDANQGYGCDGIIWAGCEGGTVAVSADSGETWALKQLFPVESACTATYQGRTGVGWAGASCGSIARTTDYGLSWSPAGEVPAAALNIENYDGLAMFVSTSAGVYRDGETPAEDPPLPGSPALRLWPNPSRNGPMVWLYDDADSPIRIAVYDLLGRRQRVLDTVTSVAGPYSRAFDGGEGLSPGVYLCTVEAAGRTVSQRFIVTGP